MKDYSIQQLQLAMERGAEIETLILDENWVWRLSKDPEFSKFSKYRLANPERDAHLTRFDLYPFDLERALSGDELITRDGDSVSDVSMSQYCSAGYPVAVKILGEKYAFRADGSYSSNKPKTSYDLFMRYASKQTERAQPSGGKSLVVEKMLLGTPNVQFMGRGIKPVDTNNKPKEPEPWQQIFANYKRKMPHAEWQAKWESGIELEYLDPANDGEWLYTDTSPNVFYENVQFREKPNTKKHQVWCVDYMDTLGNIAIRTFKTRQEALETKMPDDYKVLSEPYLKEYEV